MNYCLLLCCGDSVRRYYLGLLKFWEVEAPYKPKQCQQHHEWLTLGSGLPLEVGGCFDGHDGRNWRSLDAGVPRNPGLFSHQLPGNIVQSFQFMQVESKQNKELFPDKESGVRMNFWSICNLLCSPSNFVLAKVELCCSFELVVTCFVLQSITTWKWSWDVPLN